MNPVVTADLRVFGWHRGHPTGECAAVLVIVADYNQSNAVRRLRAAGFHAVKGRDRLHGLSDVVVGFAVEHPFTVWWRDASTDGLWTQAAP